MKIVLKFIILILFLFQAGCATTGAFSKTGYSFITLTEESGGLGYDRGMSKAFGEACSMNILGIVSVGDSSLEAARKENNLTKITHYDTSYLKIASLFGKVCTKAYGTRRGDK